MSEQRVYSADGIILCDSHLIIRGEDYDPLSRSYYCRLFFRNEQGDYESFETIIENESATEYIERLKQKSGMYFDKSTEAVVDFTMQALEIRDHNGGRMLAFGQDGNSEVEKIIMEAVTEMISAYELKERLAVLPQIYEELNTVERVKRLEKGQFSEGRIQAISEMRDLLNKYNKVDIFIKSPECTIEIKDYSTFMISFNVEPWNQITIETNNSEMPRYKFLDLYIEYSEMDVEVLEDLTYGDMKVNFYKNRDFYVTFTFKPEHLMEE